MIVDSTVTAVSRPQISSGPIEKLEAQPARPIEKPEGSLASRLDVQREKNRKQGNVKDHGGKPDARPMTYNAKGDPQEGPPAETATRAAGEPVDLFV